MSGSSAKQIGNFGESAVCAFLERHGYQIAVRNFTVRGGEIDIIAKKDNVVSFVEVKTRQPDALTSGEEAITAMKRKRLANAAERYIQKFGQPQFEYRFDVAVVICENEKIHKLKYYAGAFDVSR